VHAHLSVGRRRHTWGLVLAREVVHVLSLQQRLKLFVGDGRSNLGTRVIVMDAVYFHIGRHEELLLKLVPIRRPEARLRAGFF